MKRIIEKKKETGAIGIFVLIGMLFMASFLMILFANNMNKEKGIQEQFEILEKIYALSGGDESVYQKVYEDLREKNKQILTASVENKGNIELTKTFAEKVTNYKIYGNSVQKETPTPQNPVEIESVGNQTNLFDYQSILNENASTVTLTEFDGKSCISWINNASAESNQKFLQGRFKENTRYCISGNVASGNGRGYLCIVYKDGTNQKILLQNFLGQSNQFGEINVITQPNKTIDYLRRLL